MPGTADVETPINWYLMLPAYRRPVPTENFERGKIWSFSIDRLSVAVNLALMCGALPAWPPVPKPDGSGTRGRLVPRLSLVAAEAEIASTQPGKGGVPRCL